jgi:light-regulated signal transduction histidine kinase (bacteriophytochrome)
METVTLTIDGRQVTAEKGKTVLRAAIENLLGNAWKVTAHRNPARIEFGADRKDGETVYFVRDNGAGFDMALTNRLFTAFQRLHTESEFPGIGIGLATVQRIIHRHGGRIWAEGEIGKGAAFYFTL